MSAPSIILTTANARYPHSAFGLKRIRSALGELRQNALVIEFTLHDEALDMAEKILAFHPVLVGVGVHIWNVSLMTQMVALLRALRPELRIILGGPEMTDRTESDPLVHLADYVIIGEGERDFAEVAAQLISGHPPKDRIVHAAPVDLALLPSPYAEYTGEDIEHRVLYVESSRGCPYSCAFCLSSRDKKMRYFPLDAFLADMDTLIARGARRFKFTDRTFNVNEAHAVAILNFFLERLRPRMQIHFEIMPDRLSEPLLKRMAAFPDDVLHLEIGVQTVSPATQQRIGRCQNLDATWEAIHFLRTSTGARLHADLILGLPGDDGAVIAAGFDRLVVEDIPEIQIGLLKRLRGTAMAGDLGATSVFNPYPPYEVLQTSELSFDQLRDLKRLARYFDLYYNSGNFPAGLPLLWHDGLSPFDAFARFSRWLWQQEQRTHQLPLSRLFEQLYKYLVTHSAWDRSTIARILEADYRRLGGRRDKLSF